MSNNMEEADMTQAATHALTPKLRFPEFRDAGEWLNEAMAELYTFKGTNSLSRNNLNYENGSVKNIHYGDIHTKFSTHFEIQNEIVPYINSSVNLDKISNDSYCIEGDIIFADSSEDLQGIGKCIEIVKINKDRLVSGLHTILARQKEKLLVTGFGGHLFVSARIRQQIQNESQGAKVLGLSTGRLARIEICYPKNKAEQQKIADCLSSIDELITLEARKVDVLKAHKKGLMQQLFPGEGETLPNLRFPKFRDAGEWGTKELRDLAIIINEKAGSNKYILMSITSGIGLVSQLEKFGREIAGEQYKNYIVIQNNDFAYNKSATKEYPEGFIAIYSGETPAAVPNSIFTCFRIDKCNLVPDYLGYLFFCNLHGRWLKKFITVGARAHGSLNIDNENLLSLPIPLPTGYSSRAEQQKIADCLSSIDELIALEARKIDALKTHKKGLMQQLFPVSGEVQK